MTKTETNSAFRVYLTRVRSKYGKMPVLFVVSALLFTFLAPLTGVFLYTRGGAYAATSNTLNFQGRLLGNAGSLVADGTYNIQFNLYTVPTAGTTQWTESYLNTTTPVTIKNGFFSVYLGSLTAFPNTINWDQEQYLGMTVRGTGSCAFGACSPADAEMTPRFKLTALPFALSAGSALGVASNATATASTNSGNVGIQSGNATGATSNSGDINIDAGTATGTAGTINIGATNASALVLGNSSNKLTFGGVIQNTNALVFEGATVDANRTTFVITDPTGARTITFPDASGTVQLSPATGGYLFQVPVNTAANTITPTAASTVGLTINGTSGTAANAVNVLQGGAATAVNITSSSTGNGEVVNLTNTAGTQTSGLAVIRNGAGGTTTSLIDLTNTAGTVTNGLNFTGTYTNVINAPNFQVTNAGAINGTSLDRLTVGTLNIGTTANSTAINIGSAASTNGILGATNINTTGSATTTIGNASAALIVNGSATYNRDLTVATGFTFTNASSTLNTAIALSNFNYTGTGNIGTLGSAASTVDVATSFTVNQTTAGQTLTLPAPTSGSAGRTIYVSNIGTQTFTIGGFTISPAGTAQFVYNGTSWSLNGNVGGSGNFIQNQTAIDQTADFRITGNARANTSVTTPLIDAISGVLNVGTTTATGVTIGGTTNTTSVALQGAAAATYTIGTSNNTGGITVGNSIVTNTISIGGAAGSGATQTVNIGNSATAGSTSNVVIGSTIAGSVTLQGPTTSINSATIATNQATLGVFNTNATTVTAFQAATSISIGATTGTLTVRNANQTFGNAAGSGLFTNNGATLNSTLALTNLAAGGAIGTAAATVDIYTSISVLQTTAGQTLTIPTPSSNPTTVFGRLLYLSNIGTASFTLRGTMVSPGTTATLVWSNTDGAATTGESWQFAGADGNGILNQNSTDQTANFRISGTGRANTSFTTPLVDSITGTLSVGTTTATGVTIGGTTNTASILLQGSAAATYTIGTANNTGGIVIGNSTASNTISVGNANSSASTQTINIGGGTTATSGGTAVNIATGVPGAGTTKTVAIGNGGTTTGTVGITIGSIGGAAHTTTIQGGNGTTAVSIQAASGGTITIGSTNNNSLSLNSAAVAGTTTIGGTATTGTITLGQSTATNSINIGTAAGNTNTQTVNIGTSATAGSTSNVTIGSTIAGTVTLQSATAVAINSGSITTNATTVNLFNTNAATVNAFQAGTSISLGATTGTLTVRNANQTFGNAAGSGLFTNNGASVNTTLAVSNDVDGGVLGGGLANTASVDVYTSISVAQTTAGQTITLPTPTASTTYGRLLYLSNIGTTSFTFGGVTVAAGSTATLVWSNTNGGASWQFAGADGNGILNQNSTDQTANFRISGTGRANTSFTTPLVDSITGTLSVGTTTATGVTIGGTTNTATVAIQGAANATYTIGTANNTGGITIGNSTATNTITIGAAAGAGNTQTVNVGTSATLTSISNVTIGSAIGTSTTTIQAGSGNINLNAGTITTNAATLNLFNTTATTVNAFQAGTSISLGATTGTLTVRNANQTFGNAAGSGVFTNNGATLNTTLVVASDTDGGVLGGGLANTASVDVYTSVSINQTTASQTITIPTPTANTSYGRVLYLSNIGTASFQVAGTTVNPGTSTTLVWSNTNGGASWQSAGSGAGGVTTVGTFSATSILNGASISGTTITLGVADITNPGLISTVAQTIAGAKTFNDLITGSAGLTVSGAATSINANSNFNTDINTGTSTGTVAIGNSASTTNILGATNINTSGIALTTIGNAGSVVTAVGSTINLNSPNLVTNQATVSFLNTTATTINAFAAATSVNLADSTTTKTINLGGVANGGTDTINIATNATGADIVSIGSSNASSTAQLTGGASSLLLNNTAATLAATTINLNGGTISTNATTLGLFNTNATTVTALQAATSVSIGATTGTMTVRNANQTFGNAAGSGLFTNNGATVNTTLAVANDVDGGVLGGGLANTASVDIYTSISVAQTTAGQTITLPTPTVSTTYGRLLFFSNIGTTSFTFAGTTVNPGTTATLIWSNTNGGASWQFAGADGNGILNQNSSDQTANFRISGTGRANTSLTTPLIDSISGALSIGTTTATGVTIGGTTNTTTVGIQGASNATYTIGTANNTGGITLGNSTASNTISIGSAAGAAALQAINIGTSATASSATNVTIGSAIGTSTTTLQSGSGNINLNAGTIATTATSLNLFNTTATTVNAFGAATAINIGATTGTLSVKNANQTFGNAAGSGVFTNNGATLNTTLAVADDANGGALGGGLANTASVDVYTSISVNQTTAGQTITLPTPTASTSYGRVLYLSNVGTVSFMLGTATISPGTTATLIWSNTNGGASWQFAGADASSILNQNTADQTGNFRISGTGRANTSFTTPLVDSISGALNIGTTTATGVTIGNATNNSGITIDSGTGAIAIGTGAQARTVNIATGAAVQTVNVGSQTGTSVTNINGGTGTATGDLNLQTPAGGIINIGTASVANKVLNLGTIGSVVAASTIHIADTTGNATQAVTIGSISSANNVVLIQGGTSGTAIQLAAGSGGTISVGSQTAANTVNVGTVGAAAFTSTVNIGTSSGATQTVTVGSSAAGSTSLLQGGTGASAVSIQTASGGTILVGTTSAGTVNIATGAFANSINIGTDATATQAIVAGSIAAASTTTIRGGTGLSALGLQVGTNGAISIGASSASTVNIATGAFTHTVNVANDATTAQTVTIGSTFTGSTLALAANGAISLNATGATFSTGASLLNIAQSGASTVGSQLTVTAGQGGTGTGSVGGALTLQGGAAGGTNANGGNVVVSGGSGTGTGVKGLVVLDTTTYSTASTQSSGSSVGVTQANIDTYGAILLSATGSGVTFTVPDPTQTTAGRVIYITNFGTNDFTLAANTVGVSLSVPLKPSSTATLYWNGTDWTAAGASSSTDLQAAYNNTATSAGGAELVLNAAGGAADGLTVRNNATAPIIGGIFEAQTSVGSNLFSVNNNAVELATNGGAETQGASASTFPATTWDATTGGTVDRYTTLGDNLATGIASVRVQSTAANHGARNRITTNGIATSLTANLTYTVSFAVRGATDFSTLDVLYSPTGSATGTSCITGQTVTSGAWTRISCTFVASGGITTSNSILIRQSDAAARTFYIDNLSVNVNASSTFAADGSVDVPGSFGTNWTAFGAGSVASYNTTTIYDTSGSAQVTTTAATSRGIRNNLSITPQTNTQYLVSFYINSLNTFNDLRVRFSPDGGTSFPASAACVGYNTNTIAANTWTKVTCLFTTDGTAVSNPDLIFDNSTAATARTFYIDALSVTLNTNNASNVQVGGGNKGGPTTLFTLDRSASAPIAANNDAYLGSMYYNTTTGRIQCYEASGWGACGAPPDNIVNLNPEYAGAVLNGSGVGTMTADFCSNDTALTVNSSLCSTGQAKNFYRWTSPQATQQTYSIYVTYQLPATFKSFADDNTVQLVGRVDNTSNAAVTYEMFKSTGGAVTQCGSGETNVITGGGGSANTWYSYGISGNEATGCSLSSSSAGNFVIFKINMKSNSNANAYVSTLSFTTTGR